MANAHGKAIHLMIPENDLMVVLNNLRFAHKMLELANSQMDPDKNDQELQLTLSLLIKQAKCVMDDAIVMGSSPCAIGEL